MPRKTSSNTAAARLIEPLLREPVDRFVLPNGLVVLARADHAAAVASVQVWVRTGSIHEGARLGGGLSHCLEHMLFKGTERRAGREISSVVQAHGGYINAYTTFDRTVYYIDLPSEHVELALDVLADVAFHSTLPADEVAKERDVILREIDMCLDDPDQRLSQALMETAFREHPYRHPVIGHRDVFARLGRGELADYYRSRYVPDNMVLVVVGAFEPAAVRGMIEAHFGVVPRAGVAPVVVPSEPGQLAPRRIGLDGDVQVFRALLGYQVPGLAHPDTPALDVLSLVLGQGDSSVLWRTLREKRNLVQHIEASNWNPGTSGLFFVSMVADSDKGGRAMEALSKEIDAVCRRGFSKAQVDQAVRQVLVGEVTSRRTMAGQAARLGLAEVVVGDLRYPAAYLERIAQLAPADLARVARRYLRPAASTIATLAPRPAASAARAAGKRPAASPDFEEVRLAGGARLLVREDHRLPQVHLRVVWRGGTAYEDADRRGATALLSTLLTKDTRKRTAAEVAQAIEAVGGSFDEFSGNNSFGLALEVLPADTGLALDLLGEAILRPAFVPATVAREREAQAAEIAEENDDIVTAARRRLRELFFGGHPLAVESAGTTESVARLDGTSLRALFRKLVVSGNTVFAVSGAFARRDLVAKIRRLAESLPRGVLPAADTAFAGPPAAAEHLEPSPRQQVVVYEGYPGTGLLDDDYYTSDVADEIFSGMSSRLFERVREDKGLAYFVRSSRVIGLRTGLFFFMAGTNPRQYREVVSEFEAEIARISGAGPEAPELERCKARLVAARRIGMQSNASCASYASLNAVYGLPVNDWRNFDAHIGAVTADDVRRYAQKHFDPSRRVRLIAGAVDGPTAERRP
jgi:zinc protease